MKCVTLQDHWQMRRKGDDKWIEAIVPGSVYSNLLEHDKIQDPFYRDNEFEICKLSEEDYEFTTTFLIDQDIYQKQHIHIRFNGLDTLAQVYINDRWCGKVFNMHRIWEFDIKEYIVEGKNNLRIEFNSPIRYIINQDNKRHLWGVEGTIRGYNHLRKAHCMFGWDWGPQLPDMGIWREVQLLAFDKARIDNIYITQRHRTNEVTLELDIQLQDKRIDTVGIKVEVYGVLGEVYEKCQDITLVHTNMQIVINNPRLWWPNGLGEQPLYTVRVTIYEEDELLDEHCIRIGLRTLEVSKEPDKWGEEFCFKVNGYKIFSMGADYIPEDNILSRMSREKTEKLIRDCVKANYNSIRVWGGGFYPHDYFFDLCDEYGLIVWQDFMYACAVYELTKEFEGNIIEETIQNIKRIRHHASLGLWCGNNEMEVGWKEWGIPNDEKLRQDYIRQFEVIMKELCHTYDPETFYWPASPSSGGGFCDPNSQEKGDVHYWEVWHGNKPFEEYRKYYFRYCSEFGFESFPHIDTLRAVAEEEDMNMLSYIMEHHQKCIGGNRKILNYMSDQYQLPKNFEMTIYASQLVQADAIRYGVEHWRRHRGRCMGAIYWQINDCWPVASWSSIDYYGRWKALHYAAKRFFAPIMISAHEEDYSVVLNVTNETLMEVEGTVRWYLKDKDFTILTGGSKVTKIPHLSARDIETIYLEDYFKDKNATREQFLCFELVVDHEVVSEGTVLFIKPKHFRFNKPSYSLTVTEDEKRFNLAIRANTFTKGVCIDIEGEIVSLSNNYFDLFDGKEKVITVEKEELSHTYSLEEIIEGIKITSVFDIVGE